MEWNDSLRASMLRPEPSFNFLSNYSYDPLAGHLATVSDLQNGIVLPGTSMEMISSPRYSHNHETKKKKLTNDQLESLERSFQEEIKLDSDRKMKLSRELGLQPRQIAVWFQNRRARWKAKQLEQLYDGLRQEYDAVYREKQRLQDEVTRLRAVLREQEPMNPRQISGYGHTKISGGEETVESTPATIGNPESAKQKQIIDDNYFLYSIDKNRNPVPSASVHWSALPAYP